MSNEVLDTQAFSSADHWVSNRSNRSCANPVGVQCATLLNMVIMSECSRYPNHSGPRTHGCPTLSFNPSGCPMCGFDEWLTRRSVGTHDARPQLAARRTYGAAKAEL